MDLNTLDSSIAVLVLIAIVIMLAFAVAVIWFLNRTSKKITQAKLKEQTLELNFQKDLLSNTVKTQETERTRISSELHDDVTSKLNVVHLNVHLLKQQLTVDPEMEVILEQIDTSLKASIDRSRSIAHELMPVVLKKFGLTHALEELNRSISLSKVFDLSITGMESLNIKDEFKSLHIFRISQELLNNAIKYSKAKEVSIHFQKENQLMNMNYQDDGIGIRDSNKSTGMGLGNIHTRISLLEGEMRKTPYAENQGLNIQFKFPNHD